MARNRASMREGPLAELFRATEAAQRQQHDEPADVAAPAEPESPLERTVEHVPDFVRAESAAAQKPKRTKAAAPVAPEPVREVEQRPEAPVSRYLEALPEPAPRLNLVPRPDSSAYLAVIRVVGVGGAGPVAVVAGGMVVPRAARLHDLDQIHAALRALARR